MTAADPDIVSRKIAHIELAQDATLQGESCFSRYRLPYRACPEIDFSEIDTSHTLFGKELAQPLIIASMTGGAAHAKHINKNLAIAAQEMRVAMGVGSQRVMLRNKEAGESFKLVRKYAPDAVIFGNLGAVQLNYGVSTDDVRYLLESIRADALYLHLNPLQEAVQPEGDTNFAGLIEKIGDLIEKLDIPVFAKEVGHGLDSETAQALLNVGIAGLDVAGVSGTSWAGIEARRRKSSAFEEWFKTYGIPTDECIASIAPLKKKHDFTLVASGGVRSPIDGLKAVALGADMYSAAYPFLRAALKGPEAVIEIITEWQQGFQTAMFVAGVKNLPDSRLQVSKHCSC